MFKKVVNVSLEGAGRVGCGGVEQGRGFEAELGQGWHIDCIILSSATK